MLSAIREIAGKEITKNQAYQMPENTARQISWFCPVCKEKVIYHKKASDGTISHFKHKNKSEHQSVSEGKKHLQAKKILYKNLKQDNDLSQIELETVIGEYPNNYQVADIYLKKDNGERIAVEIQCSHQKKEDFKERTEFYNEHNVSVIWILDQENYGYYKESEAATNKDTIVHKESVKWLQKNYFGRVYFWSVNRVVPFRLKSQKVIRPASGGWGEKVDHLKTVAEYSTGELEDYGIITADSNDIEIARFYDKKWWD